MSNLSKKELAALDLIIAQLEEPANGENLQFISSIVNAVSDVATSVADVATNAATSVADIATDAISNVSVSDAVNFATNVCPAVAMVAALASREADSSLLKTTGNKDATLKELIKLRKKLS